MNLYSHLPFYSMEVEKVTFVLRSKNRRTLLIMLSKETLTPAQMMKRTSMYESHVSRCLKELKDEKLIECKNPNERRFKFYKITKKGKYVCKEVEKIAKEIA